MQFGPLFFLLMYCSFSSAQDCFSGFLEFTVTCRGESYSGPLRIELVDTHPLLLDDTIEDVQYQVNGLEDIVYFKVNLNKMKRCWEIKPKLTFYSTCSKSLDFDTYGPLLALEAPRRLILPDNNILYKVQMQLTGPSDIENLHLGRHIELSTGDYGISEFI